MAVLDKLNVVPTYVFKAPSTGEEYMFRPFLHKEEKVLQMARESGDVKNFIQAVKDTLKACSYEKFDVEEAASFDIEEFFLRIREVSIGETVSIELICQNETDNGDTCKGRNEVKIDLGKIKINSKNVSNEKKIVKLNEDVSVEMKFPSIDTLQIIGQIRHDDKSVDIVDIICTSIKSIFTKEEVYLSKDIPKKELKDFVNNLTNKQVDDLLKIVLDVPTIQYKISEKCKKCGKKIEFEFKGLYDFFE